MNYLRNHWSKAAAVIVVGAFAVSGYHVYAYAYTYGQGVGSALRQWEASCIKQRGVPVASACVKRDAIIQVTK